MSKPPSLTLQLAQALASESRDAVRDMASRKEILELWRSLPATGRLFWMRKARRVLSRWRTMGPQ